MTSNAQSINSTPGRQPSSCRIINVAGINSMVDPDELLESLINGRVVGPLRDRVSRGQTMLGGWSVRRAKSKPNLAVELRYDHPPYFNERVLLFADEALGLAHMLDSSANTKETNGRQMWELTTRRRAGLRVYKRCEKGVTFDMNEMNGVLTRDEARVLADQLHHAATSHG